jgi:hypothetical protein
MTSVAETRCLDLTVKRVIVVFVIKVEDLPRRVSGRCGRRAGPGSGMEAGEGPAHGGPVGEAGDCIGEVCDAVVGVNGREVAGETGGDWCGDGGEKEFLVLSGLHVSIGADGLWAEPPHHGLDGRVA